MATESVSARAMYPDVLRHASKSGSVAAELTHTIETTKIATTATSHRRTRGRASAVVAEAIGAGSLRKTMTGPFRGVH